MPFSLVFAQGFFFCFRAQMRVTDQVSNSRRILPKT